MKLFEEIPSLSTIALTLFRELGEIMEDLEEYHLELVEVSRQLTLAQAEKRALELMTEEQAVEEAERSGPLKDPRTGRTNKEFLALRMEQELQRSPAWQQVIAKIQELEFRRNELDAWIRARAARLRALEAQVELLKYI